MKRFVTRRLVTILCTTGLLGLSSQAMASAFQLWEQDGASVGNYHAGYAAEANNASTAFYNPAGIPRIKNQQASFSIVAIPTDFKFVGTVSDLSLVVNGVRGAPMQTNAQGGTLSFVPALHYVAPLSDRVGFGFSVDAPFGLKTNYGISTPLRYASTLTSVTVIDISPSLGGQVTDKFSVGAGLDIQKMYGEFNSVGGLSFGGTAPISLNDTLFTNKVNDTGYGYHAGILYQVTPATRIGLSYHSQVAHHLTGSSSLSGPIVNIFNGPFNTGTEFRSSAAYANVRLPAYTALSVYSQPCPMFAFMGSAIYTQWNSFKNLTLHNAAAVAGTNLFNLALSNNVIVNIPENYRNTWNFAVGANYFPTDRIILRAGAGFDETPVSNQFRNTQLPDNNRYVVAFGGHYQITKSVGADLGYMHLFIQQVRVTPPPLVIGNPLTRITTSGHVTGGADVYSAQVTWDMV